MYASLHDWPKQTVAASLVLPTKALRFDGHMLLLFASDMLQSEMMYHINVALLQL